VLHLLAIIWQPVFTPPQIALVALLLAGLALFAYGRNWRGRPWASALLLLMRLGVVASLVLLLMGPSDVPAERESSTRGEVAVVLDISGSMLTPDCAEQTRLAVAAERWLGQPFRARLGRHAKLQLFGLGEQLSSLAAIDSGDLEKLAERGRGTHLAANLATLLDQQRQLELTALLVLSDGHDTQDASSAPVASLARSRKVPIHTVTFGSVSQRKDLALLSVPMQEYLLPGEPGALLVRAYQFGLPQAETVLHLRSGGEDRRVPISFAGRPLVELQLDIRQDEPGQYEYDLVLDPVASEVESKNNRQTVFCQVQPRGMSVLMLEGQPYWDTKFLAQSLRKDERIEFTQITQVSREKRETLVSRAGRSSPQIPHSAEEWSEYDVVILGTDVQKLLSVADARRLTEFVVQHGGHLVLARGRAYDRQARGGADLATALATVEPVIWDDAAWGDLALQVTPGAAESSWLAPAKLGTDPLDAIGQLPGLEMVQRVRRLKPGTRVLVEGRPRGDSATAHPAMVSMPAGNGQVVALLGHNAWRWSLRPPTDEALVTFYDTFWSNLIRWLIMGGEFQPGQRATLQLSRQSLQLADPLDVEVAFKSVAAAQADWQVQWSAPDGPARRVALRQMPGRLPRFRATLTPRATGVHQFELIMPTLSPPTQVQKLNVYDVNTERLETSARPQWLAQLAEATGGQAFAATDAPDDVLRSIRRDQLARQVPAEPEYLWDRAGVMILLLMWMGCEWLLRRLAGLW
jgi:hypothetical protein